MFKSEYVSPQIMIRSVDCECALMEISGDVTNEPVVNHSENDGFEDVTPAKWGNATGKSLWDDED